MKRIYKSLLKGIVYFSFGIFLLNTYFVEDSEEGNETDFSKTTKVDKKKYSTSPSDKSHSLRNEFFFNFTLRPWKLESSIADDKPCGEKLVILWSMMFVIKSTAGNFKRRRAIRTTWCSVKVFRKVRFGCVFVIGISNNQQVTAKIKVENKRYGDTLQVNLIDSITTVPEKVLAGMQWATGLPDNWLYATIDDDFIVNHSRLTSYFNQLVANYTNEDGKTSFNQIPIVCVYSYQVNDVPSRDARSKWYVSRKHYSPDVWPAYCRGGMYTASKLIVSNLLKVSHKVPRIQMDDVWITGLMRIKVDESNNLIVAAPGSRLFLYELRSTAWHENAIAYHFWGNIKGKKVDIPYSMSQEWKILLRLVKEEVKCFS